MPFATTISLLYSLDGNSVRESKTVGNGTYLADSLTSVAATSEPDTQRSASTF